MNSSNKYQDFLENLNKGNICVFETDTVVGIGAKIFIDNNINENIKKIYKIKNRSNTKALPWLISSQNMLNEYILNKNNIEKQLIKEKWPGNTTIVIEVNNRVKKDLGIIKNSIHTVAFRIPDCDEIITAIDYINSPIVCTSANISKTKPVNRVKDVDKKILKQVDFVYDKPLWKKHNTLPSEIISCVGNETKILRNN